MSFFFTDSVDLLLIIIKKKNEYENRGTPYEPRETPLLRPSDPPRQNVMYPAFHGQESNNCVLLRSLRREDPLEYYYYDNIEGPMVLVGVYSVFDTGGVTHHDDVS